MSGNERSLETVARLHAEIMRERAEGLQESAQTAKRRLVEREEAIARLRGEIARMRAALNPEKPRTAAATDQIMAKCPIPEKEAAVDSARFKTASLPRTGHWRKYAPYAAIAACALALELGGARRPAAAPPDLSALARPAPAIVAGSRAAAKGAPVLADDDRSQEALLLVHEWTLPGDEKPLGERLGGELELPGGRPAWTVERTGAHGYRVTFREGDRDVPYAFEADLEARVVWPTPETQELLAPRFTAAFRDSVRDR